MLRKKQNYSGSLWKKYYKNNNNNYDNNYCNYAIKCGAGAKITEKK